MKKPLYIICIVALSCCSTKQAANTRNDNSPSSNSSTTGIAEINYEADAGLPLCIKELIRKFKTEEKQNPPRRVYSYTYNEKRVYYVPAICCDFFSDLYDGNCKLIGHPDGGYTGRGDGSAADFIKTRANEKLVWKDQR